MPGLFFGGDMAKGNDQDLPLPAGRSTHHLVKRYHEV